MNDLLARPLVLIAVLGAMSLLPVAFMGLTAFVKISTVLQIVKSAIGASSIPSNTVILALSTVLTVVAMAPVGAKIADRLSPVLTDKSAAKADSSELVKRSVEAIREPMREFLKANASPKEVERFTRAANEKVKGAALFQATDFAVLAPSFITTELTEAFSIGFLLFLPFVVIDIVVANVLLALGMQMMSPTQASMPFKLLLFVAIDGWSLLAQSLISGYR